MSAWWYRSQFSAVSYSRQLAYRANQYHSIEEPPYRQFEGYLYV
jgi:hypothetical protein